MDVRWSEELLEHDVHAAEQLSQEEVVSGMVEEAVLLLVEADREPVDPGPWGILQSFADFLKYIGSEGGAGEESGGRGRARAHKGGDGARRRHCGGGGGA